MPRYSVNGSVALFRRDWFDATRTVFQDCSVPVNGNCRVILSDGSVIASEANTPVVAGGGGVAAWLNSLDAAVHDSLGRVWAGADVSQGCSPDGAYALKVSRNSYGPWDVIEKDGSRWRLTDGDAHNIQLLGGRRAIWMVGVDDFTTPGLPIRVPLEHHYGLRAVWFPDENRYVTAYQRVSDGSLVCDGRIIAGPSDSYYYHDIEYRDGVFHVMWSTSQADWDAPFISVAKEVLPTLPWSESTPPIVRLPAANRPLWNGWFEFSGPWKSPGNVTLDVHDNAKVYAKVGVAGRFISGPTVEAIEQAAAASQERPIAYWDSRVWPRLPNLPQGSWTCLQAYCKAGETPAQFQAAMEPLIQQAWSREVVLVCQQYTSNDSLTKDLSGIAPIFVNLANKYANVMGLLIFSGYGRATGLQDHPELLTMWQNWAASVVTPVLPVYNPSAGGSPQPPKPDPIPPQPDSKYYTVSEVQMADVEIVAIKGPKGKFARIDASELGKGPFGWFPVHFDRDTPDDDCKFELSKPDQRFLLQHVTSRAILGLDATLYSDDIPRQFYGKPDAPDARGAYESPLICYDPLDKNLIFGYIPYYDYSFVSSGFGVIKL